MKSKPAKPRKVENKCLVVYILAFSQVCRYAGQRAFPKGGCQDPFPSLRVTVSPVNLTPLTASPEDVSLAGSSAGTERMWQGRRRETQSSLLCFITPVSMCLEGLLRGS